LDHTRGLSSLSANIKTLTAKMALLKQDVSSSLQSIPESSQQSVFDTYDSIGQNLHSLLHDWQSGRNDLIRLLSPRNDTPEPDESIADSGLGVSIAESNDIARKRDSCGDWGIAFARVASPAPGELDGISEETEVLEGMAKGRMGSLLSRSERIEKMRREREEIADKKKMVEERGRWMGELKDVLGQRRR
jgi:hypothetical protein